jgi:hypothetical protein
MGASAASANVLGGFFADGSGKINTTIHLDQI